MNSKKLSFFLYYPLFLGLLFCFLSYRFLLQEDISQMSVCGFCYFFGYSFFYYFFLNLVLISPFALLALFARRTAAWLAFFVLSVFLVYFVADSFVYQQFRLHLNIAMLQMTLLGGGQVVSFSTGMVFEIFALIGVCFLASLLCFLGASKLSTGKPIIKSAYCVLIMLLGLLVCQGIYGFGFAYHNQQITKVEENLPLNRPLHFNKLLIKTGLVSRDQIYTFKKSDQKGVMNYPLKPLECSGGNDYNIVFLIVDSLRFDMVDEKIMPNISAFSKNAINFKDHYSGGINTRHGIFTLFSGIPGSYWDNSKASKSGSALIKALQTRGYEIGLFASATLTMPEFNQTVFATLSDIRLNSPGSSPMEKDEACIHDMEDWVQKLPKDKPFFAFLFLDSVHAAAFPETEEFTVFKPYWKEVNQIKLSNDFDPTPYLNRYKNSVFYTDKNLGKALEFLGKTIDMDKTIVVISSDHGEEFNDNRKNYWGHNGNFTKYQAQIPLIIKWPGQKSVDVEYRTSALDVVPTILTRVLGCKNPVSDYSVGKDLFTPVKERSFVYVSNYSKDAFVEKNRIVLINELGILSFLDPSYNPSKDTSIPSYLKQVLDETSRYLKKK